MSTCHRRTWPDISLSSTGGVGIYLASGGKNPSTRHRRAWPEIRLSSTGSVVPDWVCSDVSIVNTF